MAKKKGREKREEFGSFSVQELEARLKESQEAFFRLRFRHAANALKNPMQIRHKRREVARIKTYLKQKEVGAAS
jgi:large subunit ribosomal protein L29